MKHQHVVQTLTADGADKALHQSQRLGIPAIPRSNRNPLRIQPFEQFDPTGTAGLFRFLTESGPVSRALNLVLQLPSSVSVYLRPKRTYCRPATDRSGRSLAPAKKTRRFHDGKHFAVAQVAVVRDGEHETAGFLFVGIHPFPEIDGVDAAQRRGAGHGFDQARLVAVVAEDDVAMQVVALAQRGPLVTDQRGEAPGLIVLLGGGDGLVPRAPVSARARGWVKIWRLYIRQVWQAWDRGPQRESFHPPRRA